MAEQVVPGLTVYTSDVLLDRWISGFSTGSIWSSPVGAVALSRVAKQVQWPMEKTCSLEASLYILCRSDRI